MKNYLLTEGRDPEYAVLLPLPIESVSILNYKPQKLKHLGLHQPSRISSFFRSRKLSYRLAVVLWKHTFLIAFLHLEIPFWACLGLVLLEE